MLDGKWLCRAKLLIEGDIDSDIGERHTQGIFRAGGRKLSVWNRHSDRALREGERRCARGVLLEALMLFSNHSWLCRKAKVAPLSAECRHSGRRVMTA